MFWNLENFFDHRDGGYSSSDAEFSAAGSRHWTFGRLLRKCEGIAKTILLAAEEAGGLPDIIGFAEVENKAVLHTLLKRTLLDKCGYKIVHFESPDRRGIDVALIYRAVALALRAARPVRITAAQGQDSLRTRDILLAEFLQQGGGSFSVAVNHHPSKFGGGESQWRRLAALEARCPAPPDAFCETLARFRGMRPEPESLALFALAIKRIDGAADDGRFERQLRQRAAECLRLNANDATSHGGGLYACALARSFLTEAIP